MFQFKRVSSVDSPEVLDDEGVLTRSVAKPIGYPAIIVATLCAVVAIGMLVMMTGGTMGQMKTNALAAVVSASHPKSEQIDPNETPMSSGLPATGSEGIQDETDTSAVKPLSGAEVGSDGVTRYTVQTGDTLSGISVKCGVSVHHLAEANHIDNVNLIYAGSTLVIPEVVSTVTK